MKRTVAEINQRIKDGDVVVMTADGSYVERAKD